MIHGVIVSRGDRAGGDTVAPVTPATSPSSAAVRGDSPATALSPQGLQIARAGSSTRARGEHQRPAVIDQGRSCSPRGEGAADRRHDRVRLGVQLVLGEPVDPPDEENTFRIALEVIGVAVYATMGASGVRGSRTGSPAGTC